MSIGSRSFDRIADRYDETRGGLGRGRIIARAIAPHLHPGPVLEVGVGTGAIALGLTELGHPVVGVDLSLPMLARARERLGGRVAAADGYRLPVAGGAVRNVAMVWVLHLVPDPESCLAEAGRALAPGGRLVVVPAGDQSDPDDMSTIITAMNHRLRPRRDRPDDVAARASAAGLALVEQNASETEEWETSPEKEAQRIESRTWSTLWDVPGDRWAEVVAPAIAALRALPDPESPRRRRTHYEVLVFERP